MHSTHETNMSKRFTMKLIMREQSDEFRTEAWILQKGPCHEKCHKKL